MPDISRLKEVAIGLPFSITAQNIIGYTTDQNKIWADRVRSAVGTLTRERIMNPKYGSGIHSNLFNTQEDMTNKLTLEIEKVFFTYLPLLSLQKVNVSFSESDNIIYADITYSLPSQAAENLVVGIANISNNYIHEVKA